MALAYLEGVHSAEFIISDLGLISYDTATVAVTAGVAIPPGTPLAARTADGVLVPWNPGATPTPTDGSQTLAGLLLIGVTGAEGVATTQKTIADFGLEVHASDHRIPLPANTTLAQLKAALAPLSIKLRANAGYATTQW